MLVKQYFEGNLQHLRFILENKKDMKFMTQDFTVRSQKKKKKIQTKRQPKEKHDKDAS